MDEKSMCPVSISSLICLEDGTDLDADNESGDQYDFFILLKDSVFLEYDEVDEDYVENLISRESSSISSNLDKYSSNVGFDSCSCWSSTTESWFRNARCDAIEWFLKMRVHFSFSFETAYLAVIYFDSFFSRRSTDDDKPWAVRLVSVACLSLAAKMEECRVPALHEFEVNEYMFDNQTIKRMELLVLDTLDWQMKMVTPFQYITYFISKFEYDLPPKDLVHKTIRCIFTSVDVIDSIEFRSSIIAAAAILSASCETFNKDSLNIKLSSISLFGDIDKEYVFSCYRVMTQNLHKLRSPKRLVSSTSLSANFSSTNDANDSTSLTLSRDKRRRLHVSDNP